MAGMGSARLLIALALALGVAGAHAQQYASEACPHPKGWAPAPEELQATLQAHQQWYEAPPFSIPVTAHRAILCNAHLSQADLQGANLIRANLQGATLFKANLHGARLVGANFQGAILYFADLEGAHLHDANLQGAQLSGANLQDASLVEAKLQGAILSATKLQGADLSAADLTGAQLIDTELHDAIFTGANLSKTLYEPVTAPAPGSLTNLQGVEKLRFRRGRGSGVVQLRARLAEVGLRDLERQATYALERQITRHKLQEWPERPLSAVEGAFRWAFFEMPVGYGLAPGRALQILLGSIGFFALVYLVPLSTTCISGIHQVWPAGRLEQRLRAAAWQDKVKVDRLSPQGWWGLKRFLRALQFSVLSAFHLGWRDLNVGSWIARVQAHEYTLRATGWARMVAGFQSLLSVYLLALWALTYFGRPFQ